MIAYKFLNSEGCSLLTGQRWPLPEGTDPGSWIDTGSVRPCHYGIHACRPEDLPYWLGTDLWQIELADEIVTAEHKVAARRGRIVARVEAWSTAWPELSELSAWRTRDLALAAVAAEGREDLAEQLRSAVTLDQLADLYDVAEELGDDTALGRSVGYAADCAEVAMDDEPAAAPFVAAAAVGYAAIETDGNEAAFLPAFTEERNYQAAWLSHRLQLSA